jgi:hypothetical protein
MKGVAADQQLDLRGRMKKKATDDTGSGGTRRRIKVYLIIGEFDDGNRTSTTALSFGLARRRGRK